MRPVRLLAAATAILLVTFGATPALADDPPPPPEVDITLDSTGFVHRKSGVATISGVVTCSGEVEFTDLVVELTQRTNAGGGFGTAFGTFICDGTRQPWSVQVVPERGKFVVGNADPMAYAAACGPGDCGHDWDATRARLNAT